MSYTMTTITTKYFISTVNCYLVKTDAGFILIDTGGVKQRAQIEKALQAAGCTPDNLLLIALTHGHFDHADNARYLAEHYHAKIALHPDDVPMVQRGNMFLSKGMFTQGIINGIMWLIGVRGFDKFTPDILLHDGDTLRDYGLDATVVHLPGHSAGSVGFLTSDGDYVTGDVFTNLKGKLQMNTLIDDKTALIASTHKIKTSGAKRVYVGHGVPFDLPIA